jgi:hypothetical protein
MGLAEIALSQLLTSSCAEAMQIAAFVAALEWLVSAIRTRALATNQRPEGGKGGGSDPRDEIEPNPRERLVRD